MSIMMYGLRKNKVREEDQILDCYLIASPNINTWLSLGSCRDTTEANHKLLEIFQDIKHTHLK